MEAHKKKKIGGIIRFNGSDDIIGCRVSDLELAGLERLNEKIRAWSISHFNFQTVSGKNPLIDGRVNG